MRNSTCLLLLGAVLGCYAQTSPYTGHAVREPDSTGQYRLLIGGHFHGGSSSASGFPAATILANIDEINVTRANIFLSTGDLFLLPDRDSARFVSSFFSRLTLPLFNAPGNHDLEGLAFRAPMPQRIDMGKDRILLFDTERDDSDIKGEQLELLRTVVDEAESGVVKRIFIVSHRPIWSEDDSRYAALFAGNTRSIGGCNFTTVVLPLLRKATTHTEVYWISGSMAGRAPASVFFQPHEPNLTYVQSAVRDQLRDALLLADVGPEGITWSLLSLTGEPVEAVSTYDAAWWESRQGKREPFNWRRVPYLVRKNLSSPVFWYGAATTAVLCVICLWTLTRRRRVSKRNG